MELRLALPDGVVSLDTLAIRFYMRRKRLSSGWKSAPQPTGRKRLRFTYCTESAFVTGDWIITAMRDDAGILRCVSKKPPILMSVPLSVLDIPA